MSERKWLKAKLREYEDIVDELRSQLEQNYEHIDYLANKSESESENDEDEDDLWEEVYSIKTQLVEVSEKIAYYKKEVRKLKKQ